MHIMCSAAFEHNCSFNREGGDRSGKILNCPASLPWQIKEPIADRAAADTVELIVGLAFARALGA
jgi:hypothetical protein